MGALASLLKHQGYTVTGSDGPLYPPMSVFLDQQKIPIKSSYGPDNLRGASWGLPQAQPDLVVIGNAISRSNLEAQEAERLAADGKSRRVSFAQGLAEFCIGDKRSFVVVGTHGKTSTTSLLAWALESLKLKPGFFIGGIPGNFGEGCRVGEGQVFASEGDEYDTAYWDKESKFLHYKPSWTLCTGVEFDHADIFKDLAAVETAFLKLVPKTREGWVLVDDESAPRADCVRKLATAVRAQGLKLLRYGFMPGADVRILAAEPEAGGMRVRLQLAGQSEVSLWTPQTGRHNALNLAGVLGTLYAAGLLARLEDAQALLKTFAGIKRRQEEVYSSERLTVIDDFAHHPTAIRETISAIRARYPGFKLAAFFEPRSATSARNIMAKDFGACFSGADAVFLVPPTKTNVPQDEKLDIQAVARDVASEVPEVRVEADLKQLTNFFEEWRLRQPRSVPTVALVMSNGAFGGLHGMIAALDSGQA
jgi:UDP-N-acetylmuramate: L-alanyl-gamma-D-glutamyl-meso-diaminopimelate ligase